MLSGHITQTLLRGLDRLAPKSAQANVPAHLLTGKRGEEDAYFYLRRKGYVIIARNYRTARHRGEIDLIGWDKDVLCFIEVKTRTTRDMKPAEAAVDRKKRHDLRVVVRDYLRSLSRRQFPEAPQWRFDIVTVYYEHKIPLEPKPGLNGPPEEPVILHPTFELFQNAALSS